MPDAVVIIVVLVLIVGVSVGSYLLTAFLRRRFISWILGRVRGSTSWIGQGEPLTGKGLEEERFDRRGLFDAMEGRSETHAAAPRKRTGAGPKDAGTTIENLAERKRR
jgi:hypothetical protein